MFKYIIFDFDGVLAETNEIRVEGFQALFQEYSEQQIGKLVTYCKKNGGISRYDKIRYFFEDVRGDHVSKKDLHVLAMRYSDIVRQKVIDAPAVYGSLEFLSGYFGKYELAVISGSDEDELRDVCRRRNIDHFFVEILGSPTSKLENIATLISRMRWRKKYTLFVGDSVNDFDAASAAGISFIGRSSGATDWGVFKDIPVIEDISGLIRYLE